MVQSGRPYIVVEPLKCFPELAQLFSVRVFLPCSRLPFLHALKALQIAVKKPVEA